MFSIKAGRTVAAVAAVAASCALLVGCGNAAAPNTAETKATVTGPIKFIVPAAAGGAGDTVARLLAGGLEKELSLKVQVTNVTAAGGQLAIKELADAKPDGRTIGLTNIPTVIGLYTDPARDVDFDRESFSPLAQLTSSYLSVAVNAQSPYASFEDLIKAAKERPGQINWATGGALSNDHLAILDVEEKTGADFNIVHLAGGAAKTTALLGNKIDVITGTGDALVTQEKAKQIRVLTTLGPEKSDAFENSPTAKSLGYDITQATGFFVSGPKGMDKDLAASLSGAMEKALQDPDIAKKMTDLGYPAKYVGPEGFAKFWQEQDTLQIPLIKKAAAG